MHTHLVLIIVVAIQLIATQAAVWFLWRALRNLERRLGQLAMDYCDCTDKLRRDVGARATIQDGTIISLETKVKQLTEHYNGAIKEMNRRGIPLKPHGDAE